jgi:fused signal recognition particle receptor
LRPRREAARPAPRTSDALVGGLGKLHGGSVDDALLESLEEQLLHADLGVRTATSCSSEWARGTRRDASAVREILRTAITEKLRRVESARVSRSRPSRDVVLVLGVTASGRRPRSASSPRGTPPPVARCCWRGRHVPRAAIEQLQVWGERAGCEVIAGKQGGDPSAVAFDTVKAALARGCDVRSSTKPRAASRRRSR